MTSVVTKQPNETLAYSFEFADRIGDTSVVISSISTITGTAFGLIDGSSAITISGQAIDGQDINVLIAGGTLGEDYTLLCRVLCDNGEAYDVDGILRVLDISSALVLEDGSIVAGANSYASIAQANSYLRAQARASDWDALDNVTKAGRLIAATAYLDAHARWCGTIVSDDQALGWPRSDAIDKHGRELADDEIPAAVRNAVIEIARVGEITTERSRAKLAVSVGPVSTRYADYDPTQGPGRYAFALALVSDLVIGSVTGSMRLVRA